MEKLRLNLEDIRVTRFEAGAAAGTGTVNAAEAMSVQTQCGWATCDSCVLYTACC
jgi:hypothetical protein